MKLLTNNIWFLICFFLCVTSAFSEIYKCVSDDGTVKFSDEPCGKKTVGVFKSYVPNVDEAIEAGILRRCLDKKILECVTEDLNFHAKKIADTILPRERYNAISENHSSRNWEHIDKITKWEISLYYGPEINTQQWIIGISYMVVFEQNVSVALKSISVTKDGVGFDPVTMNNVKKMVRIKKGEWIAKDR